MVGFVGGGGWVRGRVAGGWRSGARGAGRVVGVECPFRGGEVRAGGGGGVGAWRETGVLGAAATEEDVEG